MKIGVNVNAPREWPKNHRSRFVRKLPLPKELATAAAPMALAAGAASPVASTNRANQCSDSIGSSGRLVRRRIVAAMYASAMFAAAIGIAAAAPRPKQEVATMLATAHIEMWRIQR